MLAHGTAWALVSDVLRKAPRRFGVREAVDCQEYLNGSHNESRCQALIWYVVRWKKLRLTRYLLEVASLVQSSAGSCE